MQYLDSSALAKRYVQEKGSEAVDLIFERAEKGEEPVFFSMWNVGELAVVLDRYEWEGLLEAKQVMMTFLGEMKRLCKSRGGRGGNRLGTSSGRSRGPHSQASRICCRRSSGGLVPDRGRRTVRDRRSQACSDRER